MRITVTIFFILEFFNLNSVYSQIPANNLQITYIANEGYLLRSSSKKILIDALFSNGYGLFSVPSKEVTDEIMETKAPFDNISLYMLTHYHGDHCDPYLIKEYLFRHKNIPFVTSRPSIVFVDGNCFGFNLLKKQFYEMTPEINHCISKTINNIPVKVIGLKHLSFYIDSIDVEENMFNVSFIFEMDGIKIFHSGDIMKNAFLDYLETNKKWTDAIDVAFLYYGLLDSGIPDLDYILATLNPKYIVLMHVPPDKNNECSAKIEQLKARFKNIIFFKNSMDSQTFSTLNINNL